MINAKPASVDSMVYLKLFETDEFSEYNMVELHHCDGGMFMSDRETPLVHGGKTMYFRGKRIIDHVFDDLKVSGNKTYMFSIRNWHFRYVCIKFATV